MGSAKGGAPSTGVNVSAGPGPGVGAGGSAWRTEPSHWAVIPWHEASLRGQALTSLTIL